MTELVPARNSRSGKPSGWTRASRRGEAPPDPATPRSVPDNLARSNELYLLAEKSAPGSLQINLNDLSEQFEDLAHRFLARSTRKIQRVSL
jgi:hypothetical protein